MSEGKKEILLGDCLELMKGIPDGSIDMTMTSPPYDNLRTYNNSLEWGEHIWKEVIKELFRVTKEGGVVVWIVGDATVKGSETGTSFKQALFFKEVGFNIHDTMIWRKPNAPPQTKEGRRYTLAHEYMFVFSKGKINTFNPIMIECKNAGKKSGVGTNLKPNGEVRLDRINARKGKIINDFKQKYSVWDYSINVKTNNHPAAFPEQIARDHIISWSNEWDVILDPFAGSGTTGIACLNTNRQFIVMEKEQKYYDIILKRVADFNKNFEPQTLFVNEM